MYSQMYPITPEELGAVRAELFPPLYRGLINLIGIQEVYQLSKKYGGTSIFIPKKENNTSRIFTKVSPDSARKLISQYPNQSLQIPKVDKILIQIRNKRIIRDDQAGYPKSSLAIMYQLSKRRIITICNSAKG